MIPVYRYVMMPWIGLVLMIAAANGITGCNAAHRATVTEVPIPTADAELQTWEEGMRAFENEDYENAAAVFEFLSESARSERLCRRALYALACSHFAMAQTPGEFTEALALWDCWRQQISDSSETEDPRLLAPLLERLDVPGALEHAPPKVTKSKSRISSADRLAIKDLAMYKNLLQTKEKELEKIKIRLDAREKEVRRLKHQIESIEAIHLKYQEKKKESTP